MKFLRWILGLLLLTAAVLKGYALATGPLVAAGLLGSRWLMAGAVEAEAALGIWLLVGAAAPLACLVAGGCFLIYALFALRLGLAGAHSCGCFGPVPVNPWITLAIDLAAAPAALWAAKQMRNAECGMRNEKMRNGKNLCGPLRILGGPLRNSLLNSAFRIPHSAFILLFALVALASFLKMTVFHSAPKSDRRLTLLNTREWIGRRWPIGEYVEGWPQLSRGKWAVLLFSWPCGHCGETIAAWAGLAADWESKNVPRRIALIDTGGDVIPEEIEAQLASSPALRGKLNGPPECFIISPTLVLMEDGRVTAVAEGDIRILECGGSTPP